MGIAGIGASLGLVLGGVVADLLSWRVGFFIHVPTGIVLVLGAQRILAETEGRSGTFDLSQASPELPPRMRACFLPPSLSS